MCRAMKRSAEISRRPWFRSGKVRVQGARRCPHPSVPRRPLPLRPVNVRGHSARGMRAPENTNQFLMTEKYALHALRSDSVDSDSELSNDLEEYLCAYEHAHGALLEQEAEEGEGRGERGRADRQRQREERHKHTLLDSEGSGEWRPWTDRDRDSGDSGDSRTHGQTQCAHALLSTEDSCQYFPSEDDLKLSDNFMDRDFTEFCLIVTS